MVFVWCLLGVCVVFLQCLCGVCVVLCGIKTINNFKCTKRLCINDYFPWPVSKI